MNVEVADLQPGVFGVSLGSGPTGLLIRDATGSWAGHAFLYLGGGQMVQGTPDKADLVPADTYGDAIWADRMWDQLKAVRGWTAEKVNAAQLAVTGRGHALVGTPYDWPAYVGFTTEILGLRRQAQLDPFFIHDSYRVCSALVDDALTFGGVPMNYMPEDGPGLESNAAIPVVMPPNLVAPGMLLGLGQRLNWIGK